jgi:hypothetical protein
MKRLFDILVAGVGRIAGCRMVESGGAIGRLGGV